MSEAEMQGGDGGEAGDGPQEDVPMGGAESADVVETGATIFENGDSEVVEQKYRIPFTEYLSSAIVEIVVGSREFQETLSAHHALLMKSSYFDYELAKLGDNPAKMQILLPDESLDAIGCFLEYLYTGEYFPRRVDGMSGRELEHDASTPGTDDTGEQLLKHARVYILAEKFGMKDLKSLAHSKIHRVNSSARGEIAYARFVYAHTPREDITIRKPVAAFWAHRSHVLRHEAEDEFRKTCLEFPQFGFDVLSLVLDAKEKGQAHHRERETGTGTSVERGSRKRARQSGAAGARD
ncbi:MAG: hypothetical protein M4579_003899 [Chaenotheca gracillima]|nr:MAG: hypothetical protein M4579_003899 [Chaenotheca gracillima]